MGFSTRF